MENTIDHMISNDNVALLPLTINSYSNIYINIQKNCSGVTLTIPEQQQAISGGDEYAIYYAPESSDKTIGTPVLITKNVFGANDQGYIAPAVQTPPLFFPAHEKLLICLWYVLIKENGDVFTSPSIRQILATL